MQTWERMTGAARHAAAPACACVPPQIDRESACSLLEQVTAAVALEPPLARPDALALIGAFLAGNQTPFEQLAQGRRIDGDLTDEGPDVAEVLVFACLLAVRQQWKPATRLVREEDRELSSPGADVCPACGSLARLEVLAGDEKRRYLACPACEAMWRINRVGCPRCGEPDGKQLSVISHPADGARAIVHCLSCNRAWRRLDTGKQPYPEGLTLAESLYPWTVEEALADLDLIPVALRPQTEMPCAACAAGHGSPCHDEPPRSQP